MRIGIDARELSGRTTGVGRYLAGLLREWHRTGETARHEFVLYGHDRIGLADEWPGITVRHVPGAGGTVWEQIQMPPVARADRLDVFFAPAYTAPIRPPAPFVLAVHDISYVAVPEWFTWREGARRRAITRAAVRRAHSVITISQFSRTELIDRLGLSPAKVHVIPPGIDAPPTVRDDDGAAPRVLFVGSIFNRRHVPDLIRGFGRMARRHPAAELDIVGDNRSWPRQELAGLMAAEGLGDRLRWHAYVDDAARGRLYAGARAFAFLSEYEGLGLPPLEALAAGIPPLLAETAVARETCGDAGTYCAPDDWAGIGHQLESLLFDAATRARVRSAAPGVLARYDWGVAARDTFARLEAAATSRR